jgi:hypothetical protein
MSNEAPMPPSLPVYEAPKIRVPATIPAGMEIAKMPGVMNKMISRALPKGKLGKMTKLKGRVGTGRTGRAKGISVTSSIAIKSKLSKKGKETI